MRDLGDAALAAIEAGTALSVGAVAILAGDATLRIWGGYGELTLGDDVFLGVGDRGLVSAVATTLGGSEQSLVLELSGVAPENLAIMDLTLLRRQPCVVYRLVFDSAGQTLLASPVFARGRVDQASAQETGGGTSTIRINVETAARGLGRSGGRMRSDADQRLIDAGDDGLRNVTYAGERTIYWGGKIPAQAQTAFGTVTPTLGGGGSLAPSIDIGPFF